MSKFSDLSARWFRAFLEGRSAFERQQVAAHGIVSRLVAELGVTPANFGYLPADDEPDDDTHYSFAAATADADGGWTTTRFELLFEAKPETYPKLPVAFKLWLRRDGDAWQAKLYEEHRPVRLSADLSNVSPLVDVFVTEVGAFLEAMGKWPPSEDASTKRIGFVIGEPLTGP